MSSIPRKCTWCSNSNDKLEKTPCCGQYLCSFCIKTVGTCAFKHSKLDTEEQVVTSEAKNCNNKSCIRCGQYCSLTGLILCMDCHERHKENDADCDCYEDKEMN